MGEDRKNSKWFLLGEGEILEKKLDDGSFVRYKVMRGWLEYIGMDGSVKQRELKIFTPCDISKGGFPVMIASHYEIPDDYKMIFLLINEGAAVVSPANVPQEHLQNLCGDNFLFNTAVVCFVRRLEYIDFSRMIIRGGSAGGYQTLMQSVVHIGILCASCLLGITNMLYEQEYISYNNKFNDDFEITLQEDKKGDLTVYPAPLVKIAYDLISDTGRFIRNNDTDGDLWRAFSPVCHIDKITHPLLFYHSTADVLVPVNQLTEGSVISEKEDDLPQDFKTKHVDFELIEGLDKPMLDILDDSQMNISILSPDDPVIRFDPAKKLNINILDEGGVSRKCTHFKNQKFAENDSEIGYLKYYLGKTAKDTNDITHNKLKLLADRYLGKAQLFIFQNPHKKSHAPHFPGSLESDRLDVLLSLISCIDKENTAEFELTYRSLEDTYRFLDIDIKDKNIDSSNDLVDMIEKLIIYYRNLCALQEVIEHEHDHNDADLNQMVQN